MKKNEEGFVLILGLIIILALISVSITGSEQAIFEIKSTGTYKLMKQGYYITEGGHSLVTGQVSLSPGLISAANYSLTDDFFFPDLFSYPTDNSQNSDPGTFGLEYFSGADAGFTTKFLNPVSTNRVPGFSSDYFLFTRYHMITEGFYKKGAATLGAAYQKLSSAKVGSIIYVFSGMVNNL